MTRELTDATGSKVFIELVDGAPIRSYSIRLASVSSPAGRADFLEPVSDEAVRVFFHTEVDPEFSGRGLATQLIRTALGDAIEENIVVVPVCPLFAAYLRTHGEAYLAEGGKFRVPRRADLALVSQAVRAER
ncbi:GNAT family N-acetyltransferase [Microbacterium sp. SA39]|uniref:GNAT family N-acetyltransferase n=1 Tax=Microbacterium sp. SA39 TaxID=1263625 RepID=UPI0005F9A927|nr:GNAT family N-acetyltransferase [Microbacterium sp. SA39]KJQ52681.1 hypothetical protein RS85_03574 [Microbacterium sp. SA39]